MRASTPEFEGTQRCSPKGALLRSQSQGLFAHGWSLGLFTSTLPPTHSFSLQMKVLFQLNANTTTGPALATRILPSSWLEALGAKRRPVSPADSAGLAVVHVALQCGSGCSLHALCLLYQSEPTGAHSVFVASKLPAQTWGHQDCQEHTPSMNVRSKGPCGATLPDPLQMAKTLSLPTFLWGDTGK